VSAQPYSGLWPAFCLRCCLYLSTARLDVYSTTRNDEPLMMVSLVIETC